MDERGDHMTSFPLENIFGGAKLVSTDTYTDLELFCITQLELRSVERNKDRHIILMVFLFFFSLQLLLSYCYFMVRHQTGMK